MRISDWSSDVCSSDLLGVAKRKRLPDDSPDVVLPQQRRIEAMRRVGGRGADSLHELSYHWRYDNAIVGGLGPGGRRRIATVPFQTEGDRKSTRLNSSH